MTTICVASTVHICSDTRIYFKQVLTLSLRYKVDYYAKKSKRFMPRPSGKFIPLVEGNSLLIRIINNFLLFKYLIKSNYAVYHFHDPELVVLSILLRLRQKKVIFDMHEDLSKQILNKEYMPFVVRHILSLIMRCFQKFYTFIFYYLVLAEDSYGRQYNNKINIEIIHNYPLLQKKYKIQYDFCDFNMVYVGDLRKVRGVFECLNLLIYAKKRIKKINLSLIGSFADKDEEDKFMKKASEAEVTNSIIYYGRMPNEDIYDILIRSDLGLALLHPIKNYINSYPTKLFEYMSVGLPVLCSNFDLWKSIVENVNCGHTVDPFDTVTAFRIIDEYLLNQKSLKMYGINGRNAVNQNYNWEKESQYLIEIYENILTLQRHL